MSDSRDPVVVESAKIWWTEGKSIGFIPLTIFYKDETANQSNKEEVLFFQTFGLGPQLWQSIDEYPLPEATPADVYDALNYSGRWSYLRYREDVSAERFQHQDKWEEWLQEEKPRIQDEKLKEMLVAAGLEIREPDQEVRFHLVPDWESFISYEKYQEEIKESWAQRQRDFILKRAKKACQACGAGEELYGDGYRYFHRKDVAFVKCASSDDHEFLETEAIEAYSAKSKSHYHLLRGDINQYSRTHSSRRHIRSHTAFQKLLEMGKEAIPFILNDLRKGRVGGIWTAEILSDLVGQRGGDPQWWIEWAKAQKYADIES